MRLSDAAREHWDIAQQIWLELGLEYILRDHVPGGQRWLLDRFLVSMAVVSGELNDDESFDLDGFDAEEDDDKEDEAHAEKEPASTS